MKKRNVNNKVLHQQQININPNEHPNAKCHVCRSDRFEQVQNIKRLSELHPQNPTGKPIFVPVPILVCWECGKAFDQEKAVTEMKSPSPN